MSTTHQQGDHFVVSTRMALNFRVRPSWTHPTKVAGSSCPVRIAFDTDSRSLLVLPSSVQVQDVDDPPAG
eukprot:scaffold3203_cov1226-Pavlova_lutheri.AAC.1